MLARVYDPAAFSLLVATPHTLLPLLPWSACEQVLRCGMGSPTCPWRLSGAVETVLLERLDQGRTKATEGAVRRDRARLLGIPVDHPDVKRAFQQAVALERVERQDGVLQIKGVAVMARDVKARVLGLSALPSLAPMATSRLPGVLAEVLP